MIDANTIVQTGNKLIEKHGKNEQERINTCVSQVANFWQVEDGSVESFQEFCLTHFVPSGDKLDKMLERLDQNHESINGHFNQVYQDLRRPLDLDLGEITPLDNIFCQYDPSVHLEEDFFKNKIAFVILLNFSYVTLKDKEQSGGKWDSKKWLETRLGDNYISRIPAEIIQQLVSTTTAGNNFVNSYNIYMGGLIDNDGNKPFPKDLKLISHWGLRDELKAQYGQDGGLDKQQIIFEVMQRIIKQDLPAKIVNNPNLQWNPHKNELIENDQKITKFKTSNDRYQHLLNNFHAMQKVDPYYPHHSTYIKRKFELERELSENFIESLFKKLLTSPQIKKVAQIVKSRLGRELQPFDIWYDGFKARSETPEEKLTKMVSSRYPTVQAFADGIPEILQKLDFSSEKAKFIADHIEVDAARGAGHAWRAMIKSEKAHLRTRVPKSGMDYKGFNVAIHELGHNTEQTFTLHEVDYNLLQGVPCTAFTEAFAFLFQNLDMKILGIENNDPTQKQIALLDRFWSTFEIIGVSLVDLEVWRWLYKNPDSNADNLRDAVIRIAKDIWNKYYAEIFDVKDAIILGIYSHMIAYPLYLADYPLGEIISLQIEQHMEGNILGKEMERICAQGRVTPQVWMNNAVGSDISLDPILVSVDEALKAVE